MKKIAAVLLTALLVAVVALTAGCETAADKDASSVAPVASKAETTTSFKAGTWVGDKGVNYEFDADGKSGRNYDVEDGMGISFAYELQADGSCVFHMGSVDDNTHATVTFTDADHATVTWEGGSQIVLAFAGDGPVTAPSEAN